MDRFSSPCIFLPLNLNKCFHREFNTFIDFAVKIMTAMIYVGSLSPDPLLSTAWSNLIFTSAVYSGYNYYSHLKGSN